MAAAEPARTQLRVGRLVKAHGLKGALKVELYTDDPDGRFTPGAVFTLQVPAASPWHGKTVTVREFRWMNSHPVVFFDDVDVTHWPMFRRARAGVGYLPQEASVFRKLTVEDNLKLVLELHGVDRAAQKAKIAELVEELQIGKVLHSTGNVLSGGERRRVEIARALAVEPKFILLDEPFTGIDPKTIEEIQAILFRLRDRGIGILITDHNVGATLRITDRNYIMVDGHVIIEGTSKEVASDKLVRKHYLGSQFGTDPLALDRLELEGGEPEDLTE